jgi:twinkle protein
MANIFYPKDLLGDLKSIKSMASRRKGVSTGFPSLDDLMTIDKGYLSVVTGHPSSGKSEFVDAILMNMAIMHGWRSLYFSPENYPLAEHLKKHVERYKGKSLFDMSQPEISDAVEFCQNHFAFMYPEDDFTLDGILKIAIQETQAWPIDALVIDPWNEVSHNIQGRDDLYIGAALTKLRRFIREYNTHAFVVAHPVKPPLDSKDSEGNYKAPTLYDIAGGYTWRAKCDYGWAAHRNPTENVCKIIIQKIKYKSMGRLGSATFDYDFKSGRFKDQYATEFLLPDGDHDNPYM